MLICPNCGNYKRFECTGLITIHIDGEENIIENYLGAGDGNITIDTMRKVKCLSCTYSNRLKKFKVEDKQE